MYKLGTDTFSGSGSLISLKWMQLQEFLLQKFIRRFVLITDLMNILNEAREKACKVGVL